MPHRSTGTHAEPPLDRAEDLKTLAGRLQYGFDLRGTNANQVAEAIGITRQTFYAVLSGKTKNLSWPYAVKTCAHLGLRPEWLTTGELPMFPLPTLDDAEAQLIQDYRVMSEGHQKDLTALARSWADDDGDSQPSKGSPFRRIPPTQ